MSFILRKYFIKLLFQSVDTIFNPVRLCNYIFEKKIFIMKMVIKFIEINIHNLMLTYNI